MFYITKKQTYLSLLVIVFATVMITGTIESSADNSVFAKKHKDSKKGSQNIGISDHISQKAICITAGGNSPISGSCSNIADSTMNNSGGIVGGPGHGFNQKIILHGHHHQTLKCITAGGNSPITGSCTNSFKSVNGNSGGIVGLAFD
ncbi:MAG: hypothetical protein ABJB76_06375 [Candidatus Nitrosocosmicus sp.]